jgi:hypothetical protein
MGGEHLASHRARILTLCETAAAAAAAAHRPSIGFVMWDVLYCCNFTPNDPSRCATAIPATLQQTCVSTAQRVLTAAPALAQCYYITDMKAESPPSPSITQLHNEHHDQCHICSNEVPGGLQATNSARTKCLLSPCPVLPRAHLAGASCCLIMEPPPQSHAVYIVQDCHHVLKRSGPPCAECRAPDASVLLELAY